MPYNASLTRALVMSLGLLCVVLTYGCARSSNGVSWSAASHAYGTPDAPMYVILPDNYVVDLAAGAKVVLNPGAHDFALFTDPDAAASRLREVNPEGNWRVYSLKNGFGQIARPVGQGQYILSAPAEVDDWVQ